MDFNAANGPITGETHGIDSNHRAMVAKLMKPGQAIFETLTPEKCDLWHAVSGVGGEAGELVDAIKKHVAYNKPLDRENVVEELGDLEFYMEALRKSLGITREETLRHNYAKLAKRYEGHNYSDAAAHARVDKTSETESSGVGAGVPAGPKFSVGTPVIASWAPGEFAGEVIEYTPASLVATDLIPGLKLFHGEFENGSDVISEFEIPEADRVGLTIHWAEYIPGDYCGSAFVLYEKDGKLFRADGSHCSCFGLEGQWEADPTSTDDLLTLHAGYKQRNAHYSIAEDRENEPPLLAVLEFLKERGL